MVIKFMTKFDRLINILTLFLLVSGTMLLHTLTALTLKSYYGNPWGYVSFALPGLAEAYLIIIQLADQMYNFTYLVVYFICLALLILSGWFIKNIIRQRFESVLESRG